MEEKYQYEIEVVEELSEEDLDEIALILAEMIYRYRNGEKNEKIRASF